MEGPNQRNESNADRRVVPTRTGIPTSASRRRVPTTQPQQRSLPNPPTRIPSMTSNPDRSLTVQRAGYDTIINQGNYNGQPYNFQRTTQQVVALPTLPLSQRTPVNSLQVANAGTFDPRSAGANILPVQQGHRYGTLSLEGDARAHRGDIYDSIYAQSLGASHEYGAARLKDQAKIHDGNSDIASAQAFFTW